MSDSAPMEARKTRVLVVAHSHPHLTNGGAEVAAYRLFTELQARSDVEAWFLGCNAKPILSRDGVAISQPFGDREYIYTPDGSFEWFRFANRDPRFPLELGELLRELQPDVVHLHHYAVIGVDMILTIRRLLPRCRIIMTIHEFLAICNHYGQMVKRGRFELCYAADPPSCNRCFPETGPADFFLRQSYIQMFLGHIDHFISPSKFLRDRYISWGISSDKISVVENAVAASTASPGDLSRVSADSEALQIGFFGQISKLKGIDVLLDCAEILSKKTGVKVSFEIFGDYRNQPEEFQNAFTTRLPNVSRNVCYHGPYRQDQVDQLMCSVDAVLVPSIWWENSPVVIQEAFRNRRPVICSDIGGMAEKVRAGVNGFHFPVGSAAKLSYLLIELHQNRKLLRDIRLNMKAPPTAADIVQQIASLYDSGLVGQTSRGGSPKRKSDLRSRVPRSVTLAEDGAS